MLNQVVLVGRLTETPKYEERKITIAVPRSYKNENGEYDTDYITIGLSDNIAKNTSECCKKGDVIGVKGRVETNETTMYINAEKITFLSSKKESE
jgi:single-strand DNA-binding protein